VERVQQALRDCEIYVNLRLTYDFSTLLPLGIAHRAFS
jgi:hypothetical protein